MELRDYQKDLINNIRAEIMAHKKKICAVLGCGGGKSVIQGKIAAEAAKKKNRVLFIVHRKELCQQIERTFRKCGVDFKYCTVGMVQSLCRHVPELKEPKLILVDECHHIPSKIYRKIIDRFPNAIVLGFTATPVRKDEGGLGVVFETMVESVSTSWLIENNYLAPYKYYSVDLADTKNLKTKRGEFDPGEVEKLMARTVIYGDTVANWKKFAEGKQTIVYCSSINTSKKTAQAFQNAGIKAVHLDGTTHKAKREEVVADFRKGKIQVLCNVDLFGEGFDVPDCEAVVLLRPTQSLTLHIQQSMRSMRYKEGKTAIIIDHVGNYLRHGLPDGEREWTLEQNNAKQTQKQKTGVKSCPNCHAVMPATTLVCQNCGLRFRAEQEEPLVLERVQLHEISALPYNEYKKCKTFEELEWFRKAKKYKFYWTIHTALEMHIPIPSKYSRLADRLRAG